MDEQTLRAFSSVSRSLEGAHMVAYLKQRLESERVASDSAIGSLQMIGIGQGRRQALKEVIELIEGADKTLELRGRG
ncbi:MAG: hypothetical protein HY880_05970, partial [Deltaproteobacteria bacterium]|nr:hypothetical protein [Deltaproteobacteria bacterium]